jgi:hypothetical protein
VIVWHRLGYELVVRSEGDWWEVTFTMSSKPRLGGRFFCDRERIGGYVSSEAALEAATAFGAKAVREGHSIQINVPAPQRHEFEAFESWPARWHIDPK